MPNVPSPSLDSVEAGAPADKIEVTPEMIEAGVLELREKCMGEDLAEVVTDVFYALWAARKHVSFSRAGMLPAQGPHDI
jgi:hypothetical protein